MTETSQSNTSPECSNNSSKDYSNLKIGYMINPDKVFYNEMDFVIIKHLETQGATVESFDLEDIHFSIKKEEGVEVYVKDRKVNWDGFVSYGYMSKFHFEAYLYIVSGFEMANIPTLHTAEHERILSNKYEQSLRFVRGGIDIPSTNIGFSVSAFKWIAQENYKGQSVIKKLDDYAGDGVFKCETTENLVNCAAKNLWKNEYCLFQQFVPDSIGKSVRVLCINGKAVALAEYNDKTNNFKSNISFREFFSLESLMSSEKFDKYAKLGESAVKSIGNLLIGGVDILDSEKLGLVVLEINGWPDLFDIEHSTKVPVFDLFANAFVEKCSINKKKLNSSN